MAYEVLARKWRPQHFDDVVGQGHVTQTLKNAITSGRIAHAYLFVGPRGIGKTSVARIFAKALNCLNGGPTVTPCGTCDNCREITAGNSLDVMEIDGASNNGVEQVRDLRETVRYAPTRGAFKIYIIDEVHMLSTAAFNALLKTLEEPPPHVKFFFATTEPEKILATIVSRCQRFDLRRIPVPLIVERLEQIAKADAIDADRDALLAVARGAEGGMRDAQSALDQLISFKGNTIREEDVLAVFGLVARSTLERLAAQVLAGEIPALLTTVAELDAGGKDLQRLVADLMDHFRNLLVCLNVPDPQATLELTVEQVDVLRTQAAHTDTERVLRITDVLAELEDRMRFALSKRTLLETALIRCSRMATVVSLDEILGKLNALRDAMGEGAVEPSGPAVVAARARGAEFIEKRPAAEPPAAPTERAASPAARPKPAEELDALREAWQAVVQHATRLVSSLHGPLLDASPVAIDGDTVTIGFDPEFAGEIDNFRSPKARLALKHAIERVLHRDVVVEVAVAEAAAADLDAIVAAASDAPEAPGFALEAPAGDAPAASAGQGSGTKRARHEWMQDQDVRQVLEAFNGTIIDVRD
jgi:DNA polymerase III subunit gamma/tau